MDSTLPLSQSPTDTASKLPIKRKTTDDPFITAAGSDPQKLPPFKFHRIWTEPDEIRFLQGLLDDGSLLFPRDLNIFYTRFSNTMLQPYTKSQLSEKLRRLRKKFRVISSRLSKGLDMSLLSPHDRALYDLSRQLWHPDFAHTSPFNADKSKKSNLVGVKVSFLPTIPSAPGLGQGLDQYDTGPGQGSFLPTTPYVTVPGPSRVSDQNGTSSGQDRNENGTIPYQDKLSMDTDPLSVGNGNRITGKDPTHDGVSLSKENVTGKDPTHDGVSVSKENVEVGQVNNYKNDKLGEFCDGDGKLSEVNVEFEGGDVGYKRVGCSCLDGPVQVGVGCSIGEIAAKVVMDVFDECLKDYATGFSLGSLPMRYLGLPLSSRSGAK
ncbi:PREDICTED: uncharacterized protein LOC109222415 [Nicotiana attenuata]|uniref:Glabrous enhancer-binding protein-like DBD domain-containing protein n=1 Tax=Nicotiana attenuata TaxID=49451 RepID=A0A1J6JLK9_NICAT|nr:PREDICTED: uncharacterized protein LOC109222415 [Nicotiana attenuata]OIT18701.1 hypothetical protein A4A49_43673 [Nicotiana attenuata]